MIEFCEEIVGYYDGELEPCSERIPCKYHYKLKTVTAQRDIADLALKTIRGLAMRPWFDVADEALAKIEALKEGAGDE